MLSNTPEELCLGLGEQDGSNNKKEGLFLNNTSIPKSTKSPFLVPISDELQSPSTNLHKPISVKARIVICPILSVPFLINRLDLPKANFKISQKYTSSTFTIIPRALFTESTITQQMATKEF